MKHCEGLLYLIFLYLNVLFTFCCCWGFVLLCVLRPEKHRCWTHNSPCAVREISSSTLAISPQGLARGFCWQGHLVLNTTGALEKLPVPSPVSTYSEEGKHANSTLQVTHFSGWHKQHAVQLTSCSFMPQSAGVMPTSAPQELVQCSVLTTLNNMHARDRQLGWRSRLPSGGKKGTVKYYITLVIFWIWLSTHGRGRFRGGFSLKSKCLSLIAMHKLLYVSNTLKGASESHIIFPWASQVHNSW